MDRAALEREAAELEADLLTESYVPEVTGAPMKVRFLVGLAKDEKSQLATLQKYQQDNGIEPDAEFVTREVSATGGHQSGPGAKPDPMKYHTSLMYTDPATGKRTLVNPPGVDMGDLVSHSRDLARMVAGTAGGAAGAATPLPGGAGIGSVAASQGVDELIDRVLAPQLGVVTGAAPFGSAEHLKDRGTDLAMESAMVGGGSLGGKALQAGASTVKPGSGGIGPGGARLRIPGAAGSGDEATALAAAELGIRRTPAAITSKSGTVHRLTDAALKNPHTNELMQPEFDDFMKAVRGAWDRELEIPGVAAGEVRKDVAGTALQKGLSTWKDNQGVAIDRAERTMEHLMDGKPVDVTDAVAFFNKEAKEFGTGGRFPPEFKAMIKQAEQNGGLVNWEVAKRARTAIGRQLEKDDPAVIEALSPAYKVMTEARAKAAMDAKGQMPELWRTSQALEKRTAEEWKEVQQIAQQPQVESAFNMLAGSGSQGPSLMAAVKDKVPATTWDRVVATMARDKAMVTRDQQKNLQGAGGKQLEAVMSPTSYVKWYRDLKKSGSLDVAAPAGSPLRKSLDNFAEIGAAMERSGAGMTFSNSPSGIRYNEMLEGMPQGTTAPSLTGEKPGLTKMADQAAGWALNKTMDAFRSANARSQAKLLADPDFTKWMLESKAIKPRDAKGWNAHISRLSGIATSKPDLRSDLVDYVEQLDAQGPATGAAGGADAKAAPSAKPGIKDQMGALDTRFREEKEKKRGASGGSATGKPAKETAGKAGETKKGQPK